MPKPGGTQRRQIKRAYFLSKDCGKNPRVPATVHDPNHNQRGAFGSVCDQIVSRDKEAEAPGGQVRTNVALLRERR